MRIGDYYQLAWRLGNIVPWQHEPDRRDCDLPIIRSTVTASQPREDVQTQRQMSTTIK